MPSPRESIDNLRESFDRVFFYPLDKLKEKLENSNPEESVLFAPLNKIKEKVEENSGKTYHVYNDDEYINAESAIGRTLFGPIPVGHQREFFRDKKNIWVWYESWEESGKTYQISIRYEVRPDGVYKKPQNQGYARIEGTELENFRRALHAYLKLCKQILY